MNTALVTGASGFIAHHLVGFIKKHGFYDRIVGVDLVTPESRKYANHADASIVGDLRDPLFVQAMYEQVKPHHVYHLAADMGGLGWLTDRPFEALYNNGRVDLNVIGQAAEHNVKKLLYTSSAVIYPVELQTNSELVGLKESDAIPANPSEEGYGWEKLMGERLCHYASHRYSEFETRIVRLHNVYGPEGAWNDGKEKAPAAIMRKVAEAIEQPEMTAHTWQFTDPEKPGYSAIPEIEVWGDGEQSRSFLYIDDAVRGIYAVMVSGYDQPLNVGSDELVTINELVDTTARVAGVEVQKRYDLDKPQGVRGRNSDNSLVTATTGWRPMYSLYDGIRETYPWIATQVRNSQQARIT